MLLFSLIKLSGYINEFYFMKIENYFLENCSPAIFNSPFSQFMSRPDCLLSCTTENGARELNN